MGLEIVFDINGVEEKAKDFVDHLRTTPGTWFRLSGNILIIRFFVKVDGHSLVFSPPRKLPDLPHQIYAYLRINKDFFPEILVVSGETFERVNLDEESDFYSSLRPLFLNYKQVTDIFLKLISSHKENIKIRFEISGNEIIARQHAIEKRERLLLAPFHPIQSKEKPAVRTLREIREFNAKLDREKPAV